MAKTAQAKGFKLVPKASARPILAALGVKSVWLVGEYRVVKIRAGKTVRTIRIPMGKTCGPFSAPGCKGDPIFKKGDPMSS